MNTRLLTLLAAAVLLGGLPACSGTETSRKTAAAVSERLSVYRKDRETAVAQLNASYRATYLALMEQYRSTGDASLRLARRAEARAAADEMLLDWKRRSTLTSITTGLDGTRAKQVKALESQVTSIDAARRRYAESYAALELELSALEKAEKKLDELAQPGDRRRAMVNFLERIAKAYEAVKDAKPEQAPPPNP